MTFSRRVRNGVLGVGFVLYLGLAALAPVGTTAHVAAAGGLTCSQLQSSFTHNIAAANKAVAKRQFVEAQRYVKNASFAFDTAYDQGCAWTQPSE